MKLATSVALALLLAARVAAAAGEAPLMTGFTTLVGFPSSEPAAAGDSAK